VTTLCKVVKENAVRRLEDHPLIPEKYVTREDIEKAVAVMFE